MKQHREMHNSCDEMMINNMKQRGRCDAVSQSVSRRTLSQRLSRLLTLLIPSALLSASIRKEMNVKRLSYS